MLLMVGAETAIVGTSKFHWSVEMLRHLRRLDEYLTATAIVVDIVGHEHALKTMLGTPLQHVDTIVFKYDFGVDPAKACVAQRNSGVVEEIGAGWRAHGRCLTTFG
jgi:hypothetical protein